MTDAKRKIWSLGDKLIIATVLVAVVCVCGFAVWRHVLDTDPVLPQPPAVVVPNPNGYEYLLRAAQMAVEPPFSSSGVIPRPKTPGQADIAIVSSDAAAFRVLKQGLNLPIVAPSAEWKNGAKFRSLARTLDVKARIEEMQGRWDDALRTRLDGIRFAECQYAGAALGPMMVGMACAQIARRHGWSDVDHISSRAARAAARQVYDVDRHRQAAAVGVRFAKFDRIGRLAAAMAEPNWRRKVVGLLDDAGWQGGVQSSAWQLQFMSKQDLIDRVAKAEDDEIARMSQPYKPTTPAAHGDLIATTLVDAPLDDILRFLCAYDSAENRLLAVSLALRAYRLDHGADASSLTQLSPQYLPTVPVDPFDAERPFKYRKAAGVYVLYSVGPDGKDDHGRPIPRRTGARSTYALADSIGDIVAGVVN